MMPYFCSDKFRLNAQKRTVDVWLIYKCTKCNNTRNIDILTRVNPKSINSEEYIKFECNNSETAWKYAFDLDIINKNKVQVDYSEIKYLFSGNILTLKEIAEQEVDLIEFEIKVKYNIDFRLAKLIKSNLNISNVQLEQMLSNGVITMFPVETNKRSNVMNGQKIIINREKICEYLAKPDDDFKENKNEI